MIIQQTAITLKYNKIDNLKRIYYQHEGLLREHFNEATVLPIPDDAPFDVPRIIVKSKNEHSQLNITPTSATMQVVYTDGYERDWELCKTYILERMATVFDFLNILTRDEYEYIGIVSTILMDEYSNNAVQTLVKNLLNDKEKKRLYDLNVRYTFLEDNRYFVNLTLQNARLYRDGLLPDVPGDLSEKNQDGEAVGVIIDINDRYGFNNDTNYRTNKNSLSILVEKHSTVLNKKLKKLIESGEY